MPLAKPEIHEILVTGIDWNTLQLKLGEPEYHTLGNAKIVLYSVSISASKTAGEFSQRHYWKAYKRYSDFCALHFKLTKKRDLSKPEHWGDSEQLDNNLRLFIRTVNTNDWVLDDWCIIKKFVQESTHDIPVNDEDCDSESCYSANAGCVPFEERPSYFDSRRTFQSVLFDSMTSSTVSLQLVEPIDLDGRWFLDGEKCDPITIEGLMVGLKNKDGTLEEDYIHWIEEERIQLQISDSRGRVRQDSNTIVWESGEIWRRDGATTKPLTDVSTNSGTNANYSTSLNCTFEKFTHHMSESQTRQMLDFLDQINEENSLEAL